MKLEELRKIAKAMAQGIWERPKYGDGPLSVWCEGNNIADTHQRRNFSMGSTSCDANTTAIVAMANHIDALLDLWETAQCINWTCSQKRMENLHEALAKLEAVE